MAHVRWGHCATLDGNAAAAAYRDSRVHSSSSIMTLEIKCQRESMHAPGLIWPPPDQLTVMVVSVCLIADSCSEKESVSLSVKSIL